MRSLSKKFRFGRPRSKTFSLDINKDKLDKKRERAVSVVLEDYKLHCESSTSWIHEDVKTDNQLSHKEVEFSLSGDESDWKQTNQQLTIKQHDHRHEQNGQGVVNGDSWTKDVIFEAEQLKLKAEIEQLRNQREKEEAGRDVLQRKESNLDRWSSMPTILEHHDQDDIGSRRKHSTPSRPSNFNISRKLGKFPNQSLDSLPRNPASPSKSMYKSKSDRNLNEEGALALIRAAKNNSVFQASSLIKHGISTEIQDQRGWTPLCIALEHEQLKCAEVLVRWKANVNFVHHNGTSILHHIVSLGSYKGVRFLLRHGVEINVLDTDGWPAVHYGLQGGHFKCTALLFAAGCDTDYYTKKRIQEYKSAVRMSTVGKWRYQWHAQLDIDFDNQVDL